MKSAPSVLHSGELGTGDALPTATPRRRDAATPRRVNTALSLAQRNSDIERSTRERSTAYYFGLECARRGDVQPSVSRRIAAMMAAGGMMRSGIMMRARATCLAATALTLMAGTAGAQAAPASAVPIKAAAQSYSGPNVGDMAPDFALPGATRYGELKAPVKLSDFRGQTVVLAFFPGARTPGCTIQMTKYRDMYQSLFKGGDSVVVLGVSVDPDTTLADWAREAHFPMVFASDAGTHAAGTAYGAYDTTYKLNKRLLYVIGPDGRITYVAKPFTVSKMESYTALGDAVAKAAGR